THRNSVNDCLRRTANRREDDHVEFISQLGCVANDLIGNVCVRDLQSIKFNSEPAVVLRVCPGVQYRDARECEQMGFNVWQLIDGNRLEAGISYRPGQRLFEIACIVGCLYDETSGIEFLAARLK